MNRQEEQLFAERQRHIRLMQEEQQRLYFKNHSEKKMSEDIAGIITKIGIAALIVLALI